MHRPLTEDSRIRCDHGGRVAFKIPRGPRQHVAPKQDLVHVNGALALVRPSLHGHPFRSCPHRNPDASASCKTTTPDGPIQGHSDFVFVQGQPMLLETVVGYTNSVPFANYRSFDPEHDLVYVAS